MWPLLARGGLTLLFGIVTLLLLVLAVLIPGIVAGLLLVVFAAFVLLDACLGLGVLLFRGVRQGDGIASRFVARCGFAPNRTGRSLRSSTSRSVIICSISLPKNRRAVQPTMTLSFFGSQVTVRHNHQAMNPENFTPNTAATRVWRPMLARSPIALYRTA